MSAELTYDQWLSALDDAALVDGKGALSTDDWKERLGVGRHVADRWIRRGIEEGWLEMIWVRKPDRTGVVRPRPAYRLAGRRRVAPAPVCKPQRRKSGR